MFSLKINKISLRCVLLIAISAPLTVFSQPSHNSVFGQFELNIGSRPAVPYIPLNNYNTNLTASGTGSQYTVPVSRHHIIPFNVLRAFYNRVSQQNALTQTRGFLGVFSNNLAYYASAGGSNCQIMGIDLVDAANLAEGQGLGITTGGGSRLAPGFDTFEQFYAWLPGNLFIGPNNRSDDPSDGFESNARVVVGDENFNILSRTYNNMIRYNNGDNSVLNSITSDLSRIANRRTVYSLRADDWEFVNGKYRLRTTGKFTSQADDVNKTYSNGDTCESFRPNLKSLLIHSVINDD